MTDGKPTPTFDELRERRDNHMLGRNQPKRDDDMTVAQRLLQDADRDEGAMLSDYRDDDIVDLDDRPSYRSEKQAVRALREQAAEQAEAKAERERHEATQAEKDRTRHVATAGQPDQQAIQAAQGLEQRADTYRKALAEYQQAAQANDKPQWFTNDQQRQAIEAALQQEAADLDAAQNQIASHLQSKQIKSKLQQLPEELRGDTAERREFKSWMRAKGLSDTTIETSQNPDEIGVAYQRFKAEQRDKKAKERKRRIADESKKLRWTDQGSAPTNFDDAKAMLKRSGSMKDALSAVTLRRMEKTL